MVSFVCDACQDVVKKNKVEQHCQRCRNCWTLSCTACGKSFSGDEYAGHNSCVSEEEKYAKAAPQGLSKGQAKQEEWMRRAHAVQDIEPRLKSHWDKLLGFDNIPRKEKKFINFVGNSLRLPPATSASLWEIFKSLHNPAPPAPANGTQLECPEASKASAQTDTTVEQEQPQPQPQPPTTENGDDDTAKASKKKKKRKRDKGADSYATEGEPRSKKKKKKKKKKKGLDKDKKASKTKKQKRADKDRKAESKEKKNATSDE